MRRIVSGQLPPEDDVFEGPSVIGGIGDVAEAMLETSIEPRDPGLAALSQARAVGIVGHKMMQAGQKEEDEEDLTPGARRRRGF